VVEDLELTPNAERSPKSPRAAYVGDRGVGGAEMPLKIEALEKRVFAQRTHERACLQHRSPHGGELPNDPLQHAKRSNPSLPASDSVLARSSALIVGGRELYRHRARRRNARDSAASCRWFWRGNAV
jgi:hypothetical protein